MSLNRRTFVIQTVLGLGSLAIASRATAAEAVKEADPQAAALGYKLVATTVDKKKYPTYIAGQQCGTCALYQGKAGDLAGGCALFAGKQVSAKAWCSAWAKKT